VPDGPISETHRALGALDELRYAKGSTTTADLRLRMQKAMQDHAAVYRTQDTLAEGCVKIDAIVKEFDDIGVTDRSLIWNTDLIETMVSYKLKHYTLHVHTSEESLVNGSQLLQHYASNCASAVFNSSK
jgi:succinate dehydrogenase/fumarate reductase flavoprotein subunit